MGACDHVQVIIFQVMTSHGPFLKRARCFRYPPSRKETLHAAYFLLRTPLSLARAAVNPTSIARV